MIPETTMEAIAELMNPDTRELIHFWFTPCTPEAFLREYVKAEPDFADTLKSEFGIEL